MKELTSLQEQFQHYLFDGDLEIQNNVIDTENVSVESRLAIYENAYRCRLIDALATSYPCLKLYLDEEAFDKLGTEYLNKYPSQFRSVRGFGDKLAPFIESHPDYIEFPYVSELARFEWAMAFVFDAADATVISAEEMSQIPPVKWDSMRFKAHPSTVCLSFYWNVVPITQALSDNADIPLPEESTLAVDWLLWRQGLISQFCSLKVDEAWAIKALLQNATFGEICEGLCQWIDESDAPLHAASMLKGWIAAGLISEAHYQ